MVQGTAIDPQVRVEALQGLEIVTLAVHLRVRDKDHAIRLPHYELKRGIVSHLTGNGIEIEGGLVSGDGISLDGKKVKEERAVLCGGKRYQVAASAGVEFRVYLLQIRGLPTERRATIDNFKTDGAILVIDAGHGGEGRRRVSRACGRVRGR